MIKQVIQRHQDRMSGLRERYQQYVSFQKSWGSEVADFSEWIGDSMKAQAEAKARMQEEVLA